VLDIEEREKRAELLDTVFGDDTEEETEEEESINAGLFGREAGSVV